MHSQFMILWKIIKQENKRKKKEEITIYKSNRETATYTFYWGTLLGLCINVHCVMGFPDGSEVKASASNVEDHVWFFVTYHTPLHIEFPRQEYWSGLPFPFP